MLYEPIIDLSSGALAGLQAVWEGLGVAEIVSLERLVDELADDLVSWGASPGIHLKLTRSQLAWPELSERLVYRLERAGARPDQLVLEIDGPGGMALHQAGFLVARDGLGAGPIVLSDLLDAGLSVVKLDAALISGVPAELSWTRLCAGVLKLLESLNLTSGAVGVVSESQRDYLLRNGCQLAQGSFFGPALESSIVPEAIRAGR